MRNLLKTVLKSWNIFLIIFHRRGRGVGGWGPPWKIPPILLLFLFNPSLSHYFERWKFSWRRSLSVPHSISPFTQAPPSLSSTLCFILYHSPRFSNTPTLSSKFHYPPTRSNSLNHSQTLPHLDSIFWGLAWYSLFSRVLLIFCYLCCFTNKIVFTQI